jgi:hypothetical protein
MLEIANKKFVKINSPYPTGFKNPDTEVCNTDSDRTSDATHSKKEMPRAANFLVSMVNILIFKMLYSEKTT